MWYHHIVLTTAQSENFNTSKTQEIDHKTDFKKMIEVLEEEIKKIP